MGELRSTIEIDTEGTKQFLSDMRQAKKELEAIEAILLGKGFTGSARELKRAAMTYRTEFLKAIKDIKEADLSRTKEVIEAQKEFLSGQDSPEAKADLEQLEVASAVLNELNETTDETADSLDSLNESLQGVGDGAQDMGEGFEASDEQIQNAVQSIAELEARNKEIKTALKNAPQKGQEGYEDLADVIAELTAEFSDNRVNILEFNRGLRQGVQETELAQGSILELSQIVRQLTADYSELSEEERNSAEGVELKEKIRETKDELNDLRAELGDNRGFVGAYGNALNGLGTPLQGAKRGIAALSNGFKLLLANPVVALIAAIVAGLTFLFKAFASTKEGAEFLDRAAARLSATLDVIRDIAVNVGKGLVAAFKDPIGSIKALGTSILNNLSNRFTALLPLAKGVGNVLKGAVTGNLDLMKESAQGAGRALIQVGTGFDIDQQNRIAAAFGATADEISREADNAARLTGILQTLTDIQRRQSVNRAKLNAELTVQKNIARDTNVALSTRIGILDDVLAAESKLLAVEIGAQQARVEALRQLQAQSDSSPEDLDKLAQEEIKLANLRQQSASRELSVNRQLIQLRNERRRNAEKASKAEEKRLKLVEKERNKLILVIQKSNSNREAAIKKFADKIKRIEVDAIQDVTKKLIEEEKIRAEKIRDSRDGDFNKAIDQLEKANRAVQENTEATAEEKKAFEEKTNADIFALTEINNKLLQRQEQQHLDNLQRIKNDAAERERIAKKEAADLAEKEREKEAAARAKKEEDEAAKRQAEAEKNAKAVESAIKTSINAAFTIIDKVMQAAANAENENFDQAIDQRQKNIDALTEDLEGATGVHREFLEKQLQQEKDAQKKLKTEAERARKEQAAAARDIAIVQAIVNTAVAVTSALATPPYPVGVALAISAAALGAVEIATIATASFQDGGEVVGKSHAQGGVRASVIGGADVELEGGEIVFSRKAVAFHGKDNLLAANEQGNSATDSGKRFQFGGDVTPNFQAISQTSTGGQDRLLKQLSDLNISVNVTDISNLQDKQAKVSNQTSF